MFLLDVPSLGPIIFTGVTLLAVVGISIAIIVLLLMLVFKRR